MSVKQQFEAEGIDVRRVEYDDSVELVADLGTGGQSAVDVVGDTIIVLAGGEQFEIEAAAEADPQAFISNGVLTIEVER